MATWSEPQFDPSLPPFSSRCVGVWFAQFEAAPVLNIIRLQELKYEVLFHVMPLNLQLHLGVPSPGPRPYDELRQSVLNYYGTAYHPLPEIDRAVRVSSLPVPSPPAPDASAPAPACHRPQATSSPLSPPTVTRGSGDMSDPTPAPEPHAIGSGDNAVAPAIRPPTNPSPDLSTLPAERASESAHEPCPVPTPLPLTVSAVTTPRHLPASESDAAAAATFPALRSPSPHSAHLPLGPSSDYSDKSDVGDWEQWSRDADRADILTPPSRDASRDAVSHPPPGPVLRVVPALERAKHHDSAAAAPAVPHFPQPAPVPSSNVVRRCLPGRLEHHSRSRPLTVVRPRLRPAHSGLSSPDTGGVAHSDLQLATSTARRARPDQRTIKLNPPQLTLVRG